MKYLSILASLRAYGRMLSESSRSAIGFGRQSPRQTDNFVMFDINQTQRNNRTINTIAFKSGVQITVDTNLRVPSTIPLPPILEIEWMQSKKLFTSDQLWAFEYLAYAFVVQFLGANARHPEVDYRHPTETLTDLSSLEFNESVLQEHYVIIDVEELKGAPQILSAIELPAIKMPKLPYWRMSSVYQYNNSLSNLYDQCMEASPSYRGLYLHLPFFLSMFIVDCYAKDFKHWSAAMCLDVQTKLTESVNRFNEHSVTHVAGNQYTFGAGGSLTARDFDLLRDVFTVVADKLQRHNTHIGLINYSDYEEIVSTEHIFASVRLSNMGIKWSDEIKKAEMRKQQEKEEATS